MSLRQLLKRVVARAGRSESWPARQIDAMCRTFHEAHENHSYNGAINGEDWLLERLGGAGKIGTFFDVGANRGDWAATALRAAPNSKGHCFELMPPIFELLKQRMGGETRLTLNPCGLSDSAGEVTAYYCADNDEQSSLNPALWAKDVRKLACRVDTGAAYCAAHGVERIDLLKVDTEGAENRVFAGFGALLNPKQIPVVQFEYGMMNIDTHYLLKDFHAFFTERGYKIGKLMPRRVRFRDYARSDEDFLGPNFVAAAPELVPLLS